MTPITGFLSIQKSYFIDIILTISSLGNVLYVDVCLIIQTELFSSQQKYQISIFSANLHLIILKILEKMSSK